MGGAVKVGESLAPDVWQGTRHPLTQHSGKTPRSGPEQRQRQACPSDKGGALPPASDLLDRAEDATSGKKPRTERPPGIAGRSLRLVGPSERLQWRDPPNP